MVGETGVTFTPVAIETNVEVDGSRGSDVIVGTGVRRTACSVEIRSRGAPVAGRSQISCLKMLLSMGGMEEGRVSAL